MEPFKQKWINVQNENNYFKWIHDKEEFAKKFGTAETVIIEYYTTKDFTKIYHNYDVRVKYNLFGIFPLSTVTFGKNLSFQEVKELKVPFAKLMFSTKYNEQAPRSYPIPKSYLV